MPLKSRIDAVKEDQVVVNVSSRHEPVVQEKIVIAAHGMTLVGTVITTAAERIVK